MSQDLHPHWDATDEEGTPLRPEPPNFGRAGDPLRRVPVHSAGHGSGSGFPPHTKTISRRPAAIAGILIVIAVGAGFVRGVESLTGQLNDRTDVIIGSAGIDPPTVTIEHGQEIVWKNEQQVPHYLISDTLCRPGGLDCLNTITMFPGDEAQYTIPGDILPGSYPYESGTDPLVRGTIVVIADRPSSSQPAAVDDGRGSERAFNRDEEHPASEPEPQPPQSDMEPDAPASRPTEPEPSETTVVDQALLDAIRDQLQSDATVGETPTASDGLTATVSGIPTNPYTVDSGFAQSTYPPSNGDATFAGGIQKPFRQPDTGPGVWIVIALAVGLLLFVTRGCMMRAYK